MKNDKGPMKPVVWLWIMVATVFAMGALCPPQALAQVPARFYWKTLSGANAVPLIVESLSGNTNPFDPAHNVTANAEIDATMALMGYAKFFPLFDRAAMAALRYAPGFSVDLLADLALPIGEYDSDQPLNIGQNRWYGRLGLPIIWQFGPWVPGRRTTLELLPAVWLFGDNDDYVGQTLETDPMFQVDAHLTRDLTENLWGSLDGAWYSGGKATINGVSGEKLDNLGLGLTLGYQINENLSLTVSYKSSLNDDAPDDLRMDNFMVSFVYGWHKLVEGTRRLKSGGH